MLSDWNKLELSLLRVDGVLVVQYYYSSFTCKTPLTTTRKRMTDCTTICHTRCFCGRQASAKSQYPWGHCMVYLYSGYLDTAVVATLDCTFIISKLIQLLLHTFDCTIWLRTSNRCFISSFGGGFQSINGMVSLSEDRVFFQQLVDCHLISGTLKNKNISRSMSVFWSALSWFDVRGKPSNTQPFSWQSGKSLIFTRLQNKNDCICEAHLESRCFFQVTQSWTYWNTVWWLCLDETQFWNIPCFLLVGFPLVFEKPMTTGKISFHALLIFCTSPHQLWFFLMILESIRSSINDLPCLLWIWRMNQAKLWATGWPLCQSQTEVD